MRCCFLKIEYIQQILVSLGFLTVFSAFVFGQTDETTNSTGNDETRDGRVLSEGTNTVPSGDLRALSYKLEEIRPTRTVRQGSRDINLTGFRLTISVADRLNGSSYRIWIGDNSYSAFGLGLYKIGIVLHSPGLPNGTSLAISSLGVRDHEYVPANISVLPERLFVPPPYGYDATDSENNNYVLKRVSRFVRALNRRVPGVAIQVPSEDIYQSGSNNWYLQIGEKDYFASAGGNLLSLWFSDEEFARLNDGDRIKVKYGKGPLANGRIVGRLSKSLVQ